MAGILGLLGSLNPDAMMQTVTNLQNAAQATIAHFNTRLNKLDADIESIGIAIAHLSDVTEEIMSRMTELQAQIDSARNRLPDAVKLGDVYTAPTMKINVHE